MNEKYTQILNKYVDEFLNDNIKFNLIILKGEHGCGKTTIINECLNNNNHILKYHFDFLSLKNIKNTNEYIKQVLSYNDIISSLNNTPKRKVFIFDNIDSYPPTFKAVFFKILEQIGLGRKTVKKKNILKNLIICSSHNYYHKITNDLLKKCHIIDINKPSKADIIEYVNTKVSNSNIAKKLINNFKNWRILNNDILKYNNNYGYEIINNNIFDVSTTIRKLLQKKYDMDTVHTFWNIDRSKMSLMYHENFINYSLMHKLTGNYYKFLENLLNISNSLCNGDSLDFRKYLSQTINIDYIYSYLLLYNPQSYFHNFKYKNDDNYTIKFTQDLTKNSNKMYFRKYLLPLKLEKNINTPHETSLYFQMNFENDNIIKDTKIRYIKTLDNCLNNSYNECYS